MITSCSLCSTKDPRNIDHTRVRIEYPDLGPSPHRLKCRRRVNSPQFNSISVYFRPLPNGPHLTELSSTLRRSFFLSTIWGIPQRFLHQNRPNFYFEKWNHRLILENDAVWSKLFWKNKQIYHRIGTSAFAREVFFRQIKVESESVVMEHHDGCLLAVTELGRESENIQTHKIRVYRLNQIIAQVNIWKSRIETFIYFMLGSFKFYGQNYHLK